MWGFLTCLDCVPGGLTDGSSLGDGQQVDDGNSPAPGGNEGTSVDGDATPPNNNSLGGGMLGLSGVAGDAQDDGVQAESELVLDPNELSLTSLAPQGSFSLQTRGGGIHSFGLSCNAPWLSVAPPQGTNNGEIDVITVSADGSALDPGDYVAEVLAVTNTGRAETVRVTFTVLDGNGDPPADPTEHTISGWLHVDDAPLEGVLVSASNGVGAVLSGADGSFAFVVPHGWSGEISPRDANYDFEPTTLTFANIDADSQGNGFGAGRRAPSVPMIGVRRASDQRLLRYQGDQPDSPIGADFEYSAHFEDADVIADLRWLGDDQWELRVTPKVEVTEVWFPFELDEYQMGDSAADDLFYVTRLCGDAWKSDVLTRSFYGPVYPGAAFAPLVVFADSTEAKMLAAVNWPPRVVQPLYARGRMGLRYGIDEENGYNEVPNVGEMQTYRLLQARASGDESVGVYAWQRTVDQYKAWFTEAAGAAGLWPVPYSAWMRNIDGWMTVHLEGLADDAFVWYLEYYWDNWGQVFPWMQMWGQTSAYDPDHGCCNLGPDVHPRYLPELPEFTQRLTQQDGHVSYYARVADPYPPIDGSIPGSDEYRQAFLEWLNTNASYGTDAHYLDVFGARYFGHPTIIPQYFLNLFPENTVIEYPVDIYPTAYNIANCIYGNGFYSSGPDYTDCPDCFDDDNLKVTFPRFGRYLLDDRVIFLGTGNGGVTYWGAENNHWQERQVFLLGAKIDVHCGLIEDVLYSGELNEALALIIGERNRVGWWQRNPKYRDRSGIHEVPPDVEVRRYVDDQGVVLFAIDNWQGYAGLEFRYNDQVVEIPSQRLSIVELP